MEDLQDFNQTAVFTLYFCPEAYFHAVLETFGKINAFFKIASVFSGFIFPCPAFQRIPQPLRRRFKTARGL
ncbi:hypothetical protein [Acinetobacter sp.]|uniref:hypothetical protein n=1 Tax=Acinetobacter sp. TaxID=472 RepID=UPI0035B0F2DA